MLTANVRPRPTLVLPAALLASALLTATAEARGGGHTSGMVSTLRSHGAAPTAGAALTGAATSATGSGSRTGAVSPPALTGASASATGSSRTGAASTPAAGAASPPIA